MTQLAGTGLTPPGSQRNKLKKFVYNPLADDDDIDENVGDNPNPEGDVDSTPVERGATPVSGLSNASPKPTSSHDETQQNKPGPSAESPVAAVTSKEPVIPEVNINDENEFHTEKIENSKKRGSTRCSILGAVVIVPVIAACLLLAFTDIIYVFVVYGRVGIEDNWMKAPSVEETARFIEHYKKTNKQ